MDAKPTPLKALISFINKYQNILYPLLALVAGLHFFTFGVLGYPFTFFPGDMVDARLNTYFLEHAHHFLTLQLPGSFWDAPFMYPEPQVLAYSDNLLGAAPIYSFFRLLGVSPLGSFQAWFLLCTILNFGACYWLFKTLRASTPASALGAFVFAFSLALFSQLTHAQTFPRFAIPLSLLFAYRFFEHFKVRDLALALFFVIYQIYCGIYLGFFAALLLLFFILSTCIVNWKQVWDGLSKRLQWKFVPLALAPLFLLLPIAMAYIQRDIGSSEDHFRDIFPNLPSWKSYLSAPYHSGIWRSLSEIGKVFKKWWDHELFMGLIGFSAYVGLLLVSTLAVFRKSVQRVFSNRGVMTFGLAFFILALFYIRNESYSLNYFIYQIPGFSALRAGARIINLQLIGAGLGLAWLFGVLEQRWNRRVPLLFGMVLALLLVDNSFQTQHAKRTPKAKAQARIDGLAAHFDSIPKGAIISYEPQGMPEKSAIHALDAMLASQVKQQKVINGYSAKSPTGYVKYWEHPSEHYRNFWLSQFDTLELKALYVVSPPLPIKKLEINELQKAIEVSEIEVRIENIRKSPSYLNLVKKKAEKRGISLDSMLYLDAQWSMRQRAQ